MSATDESLISSAETIVNSAITTTTAEINCTIQTYDDEANISISPSSLPVNIQMDSLVTALASTVITEHPTKSNNWAADGNDSGVEAGTISNTVALQRALSSNSAGYASSSGGLEAPIGNVSCNSSILSFCSDSFEGKTGNGKVYKQNNLSNDCTSEGGSESSSVSGGPTNGKRSSTSRRKIETTPPPNGKHAENSVARSRTRAASASRAMVHINKPVGAPNLATMERARSRDKTPSTPSKPPTVGRSVSLRRTIKPETLPTGLRDPNSPAVQRVALLSRTPSITRGRTPLGTPNTDDRRWPSINGKHNGTPPKTHRGRSTTPEKVVVRTKYGPMVLENKSANSIEKFATLPRRRRERSVEDSPNDSRSNSIVRDRMSSSINGKYTTASKESSPQKTFPPYGARGRVVKTKIYHETSIQTAMTGKDIDDAFAGKAKDIRVDAIQQADREVQVDIRDKQIEQLEEKLQKMRSEKESLQKSLLERNQILITLEQQLNRERDEKDSIRNELQSNTDRVLGMLESVYATPPPDGDNCDSLLMLESQIQMSGHALEEKQDEINTLRSLCRNLQDEMKRSFNAQKNLLQQKEFIEKETSELQDFLQDEKTAAVEALKEAELEIEQCQQKLEEKEVEVERLRDECRHLVRMSEQRRQEYLGMQSKYTALESRSKEMVVQQGSAISCATSALTGLTARLNSLVEQLVTSYNISEQELEDLVYHNEAYAMSSEDGSPENEQPQAEFDGAKGSMSPQRHQSFIKAVLSAIKSAAITAKSSVNKKATNEGSTATDNEVDESDSTTEMLDSETEPCLMMEHVLEDVPMPDSHSHNMVSSQNAASLNSQETNLIDTEDANKRTMNRDEESLYNLCQAIANRQEIEHQTNLMMNKRTNRMQSSLSTDTSINESMSECYSAQALVDQIIDVDNLVTKLLKILRIIQIEDDHCIQRLIGEKNVLQLNQGEVNDKLKDTEMANIQLKFELEVTSKQLMINSNDLASSRVELQQHRNEIDRLNEDICNLSTLCSQSTVAPKQNFMNIFNEWKANNEIPKPEIVAHILNACNEIPILQEILTKKENQLTELTNNLTADPAEYVNCQNKTDAIQEVKREREAINRAIETLNSIQSIVHQWPALKANTESETSNVANPLLLLNGSTNSDCNANGIQVNSESVHTNNSDTSPNTTIDLSV